MLKPEPVPVSDVGTELELAGATTVVVVTE